MEVSRIRALRGPNFWSRLTAIEAVVTCAGDEADLDRMPGFVTRLRARFPEMKPLRPLGHKDPISVAHAIEAIALGLQAAAGCPVAFGHTATTPEPNVFQVVFQYSEEPVGRRALELAEALCQAALNDSPFDIKRGVVESGLTQRLSELEGAPSNRFLAILKNNLKNIRFWRGRCVAKSDRATRCGL